MSVVEKPTHITKEQVADANELAAALSRNYQTLYENGLRLEKLVDELKKKLEALP